MRVREPIGSPLHPPRPHHRRARPQPRADGIRPGRVRRRDPDTEARTRGRPGISSLQRPPSSRRRPTPAYRRPCTSWLCRRCRGPNAPRPPTSTGSRGCAGGQVGVAEECRRLAVRSSRHVEAPVAGGFSMLGVTWRAPATSAAPPRRSSRCAPRRTAAGRAGPTRRVDPDEGPAAAEESAVRDGTEPIFVGDADAVEVDVYAASGTAPADLRSPPSTPVRRRPTRRCRKGATVGTEVDAARPGTASRRIPRDRDASRLGRRREPRRPVLGAALRQDVQGRVRPPHRGEQQLHPARVARRSCAASTRTTRSPATGATSATTSSSTATARSTKDAQEASASRCAARTPATTTSTAPASR